MHGFVARGVRQLVRAGRIWDGLAEGIAGLQDSKGAGLNSGLHQQLENVMVAERPSLHVKRRRVSRCCADASETCYLACEPSPDVKTAFYDALHP